VSVPDALALPTRDADLYLATAIEAARAGGDVIRDGARSRASLTVERNRPTIS
jgi:hypothetical protein